MVILLSPQNNYFRPQRYSHTSQSSTGGPNSPGPHSPASPGPHLPLAEPISPRLPPTPPPPPPPLPPRRRRDSPEISSPQQVRHIRHFVCNLLFFFYSTFCGFLIAFNYLLYKLIEKCVTRTICDTVFCMSSKKAVTQLCQLKIRVPFFECIAVQIRKDQRRLARFLEGN